MTVLTVNTEDQLAVRVQDSMQGYRFKFMVDENHEIDDQETIYL